MTHSSTTRRFIRSNTNFFIALVRNFSLVIVGYSKRVDVKLFNSLTHSKTWNEVNESKPIISQAYR